MSLRRFRITQSTFEDVLKFLQKQPDVYTKSFTVPKDMLPRVAPW